MDFKPSCWLCQPEEANTEYWLTWGCVVLSEAHIYLNLPQIQILEIHSIFKGEKLTECSWRYLMVSVKSKWEQSKFEQTLSEVDRQCVWGLLSIIKRGETCDMGHIPNRGRGPLEIKVRLHLPLWLRDFGVWQMVKEYFKSKYRFKLNELYHLTWQFNNHEHKICWNYPSTNIWYGF